jgi:HJR/Mrr/RecB family endonuclease
LKANWLPRSWGSGKCCGGISGILKCSMISFLYEAIGMKVTVIGWEKKVDSEQIYTIQQSTHFGRRRKEAKYANKFYSSLVSTYSLHPFFSPIFLFQQTVKKEDAWKSRRERTKRSRMINALSELFGGPFKDLTRN